MTNSLIEDKGRRVERGTNTRGFNNFFQRELHHQNVGFALQRGSSPSRWRWCFPLRCSCKTQWGLEGLVEDVHSGNYNERWCYFRFFFFLSFFLFWIWIWIRFCLIFQRNSTTSKNSSLLVKGNCNFSRNYKVSHLCKTFFLIFFYLKKSFHRSSHESPRGQQQLHTLRRHRCHSGQGWVTVKIERWMSFSHNLFSCFSSCFLFSFFLSIIQQLLNSLESRSSRRRDPLTTSLWKSQLWRISLARRWERQ